MKALHTLIALLCFSLLSGCSMFVADDEDYGKRTTCSAVSDRCWSIKSVVLCMFLSESEVCS